MNELQTDIEAAWLRLIDYCKHRDWRGYDPYDGLNNAVYQRWRVPSKAARIAIIQLFRRIPINVRPVLGVRQKQNPKGLALFAKSLLIMGKIRERQRYFGTAIELLTRLCQLRATGYSGACWGYGFDWQNRTFFLPKGTPNIVCTAYAANAFVDAYETLGEARYLDIARSSCDFVLQDLRLTEGRGICFSYTPLDTSRIYNASLWAAQLLYRIGTYTGEDRLTRAADRALDFVLAAQLSDGSWYYGEDRNQRWIDSYHTGFVLEALWDCLDLSGRSDIQTAVARGLEAYLRHFLLEDGRLRHRPNRVYPIDIHAQAQGILTLVRATRHGSRDLLPTATRVAAWTIREMQRADGGFHFQRHRFWTNRIVYMRWANAWLAYALSALLECHENTAPHSVGQGSRMPYRQDNYGRSPRPD